ncbi:unnamed protein product [Amoebophrya sp. A25]|nr:unnamed protein product [Amoebophrya sp. A25]|eukprot:GSA25T00006078001.1
MPMRRMMSSWSAASFKAEQEGGGEASPIDLQPASLRLVVCGTLCGTLNNASFCVLLGAAQKVAADFDRVNDVSLMTMMGTVGCLAGIVLNAKLCVGFSTETRRLSMLLTLITFGYLVIIFAYHFLEGTAAGFFLCVSASMLLGGASAAGEVLNLGLFRAFAPTMLSSWGAGTGMSGIFGPSIYLALTTGLGLNSGQVCWFLIATLPLYFFFFWTIVRARDEYDAAYFEEEEEGFASDNEVVERPHVPIENQAAPSGSTTVVTHTEQASTTSGDTSTTRDAVSSSGNSSSSSRSGSATTTGDQGSSGVASSNSLASTASTSAGSGSDVPPNQDEPAPDVVPPKRRSPSRRSVAGRTSILEQGGDLMYPEAAVPVFRTSSIPQIDNLLRSPVSVPVSRRSRSRESILGGIDENGGMNAVSTCSLTAANTNVNAQKHGDVGEQEQHDESVAAVSREPNDGADADVNSSRMKMSGAQSPSEQPQSIALTWRNFRKVVTKCRFIMMNMVAVYSLEYLIMSGALDRVTLCPTSQSFIATDAYTVYWCLYNVGVTLSRASVALFRIQRVWILTVIQLINTMLWYTEAFVQLHRHLFPAGDDAGYYIMAVHMIWVGFMGGACYSNCMFLFNTSKSIPAAYRELGLNVGFLFSNLGIISATFLAFLLDATVMSNKKLFPPDGSCPAAGMEEAGIAASGTSTVDSSSHNAATLPPSSSFGGDNYVPLDINGNMVFTNGNVFPGTAAAVISLVSKRFLGAAAP